jgi:hypothetical protein
MRLIRQVDRTDRELARLLQLADELDGAIGGFAPYLGVLDSRIRALRVGLQTWRSLLPR